MSVTSGGEGAGVVTAGFSETVVSGTSTFAVVVLKAAAAEVGADVAVVVAATWSWVDVGDSGADVVEVVRSGRGGKLNLSCGKPLCCCSRCSVLCCFTGSKQCDWLSRFFGLC